ncbi:MAG: hypothetical protein Tp1111SUR761211_25 [Prokaryotic dsDNA virus sp.]|nr:MAG: hypothetical protein Tp1111SUR761211_25 [Prokaryotic dsDNA virus sp.]|tara:strand:- start:67 stop:381 length:315 start_codon:yes stop_codon:yes gene_type:complete
MNKKINNFKEIEYYTNFNLVGEHIVQSRKLKPENKALNDMYFSWQEVGFYVNNLIRNERMYEQSLSEYRSDKIRAVERARTAEQKVTELEQELEKLKTKKSLGL